MSMTLTDRLTRGTYLFDNGEGQPGVICLTYSWMSDALKMLPEPVDRRVRLALNALAKIYPDVDIASHIIGDPITVSWEADRHFLGAFKGALPGHYRYNQRMYAHFMQDEMPEEQRGIFLAGDDVSWTPAWVEGAVQTSLNAVWGIMHHLGGATHVDDGAEPESTPTIGRKARILVVEDSVGVRELERVILESAGYDVVTAVDGLDGIARLRAEPADLVLSDVEMPGMDGFTLTRTIRRTRGWEQVPVVIMTSRGDESDRRAGLEAGASAYLLKSDFDQTELVDTVRRLVGR